LENLVKTNLTDPAANLPRTGAFVRAAITMAMTQLEGPEPRALANRWAEAGPNQREAVRYFAAGEVPSADVPTGTGIAQAQLGLAQQTILGQLRGAVDLALNTTVPFYAAADVSGAQIVAPGNPIPCLSLAFDKADLTARKAAAIIAVSRALLEQPSAEPAFSALLLRAAAKAVDAEFLRLALDGADPVATAANDPMQLLAQVNAACAVLIAAGADARFITLAANPSTLLDLATCSTTLGARAFPEVTSFGGTLAGLPLLPSLGVTVGQIAALAGDAVLRSTAPPRIETTTQATIEQSTQPTGKAEPGQTPVAASQVRIGLWQADMVAIKVTSNFACDFTRTAAAYIDGIDLAGEVSA
jgi:hypothetical protein